jgi:tRNA (cmo5U34)-methyltransferase
MANEWQSTEHALGYLKIADTIPHRTDGEAVLLDEVPKDAKRILDLGSGDGRLMSLLLLHCPSATGVAQDFSPAMLERLQERFRSGNRVQVLEHDLDHPLPDLGKFDVVASSFAIHHLTHERKRQLYEEIWDHLLPRGVFCNLEHVASPSERIHKRFYDAIGVDVKSASKMWTVSGSGESLRYWSGGDPNERAHRIAVITRRSPPSIPSCLIFLPPIFLLKKISKKIVGKKIPH